MHRCVMQYMNNKKRWVCWKIYLRNFGIWLNMNPKHCPTIRVKLRKTVYFSDLAYGGWDMRNVVNEGVKC